MITDFTLDAFLQNTVYCLAAIKRLFTESAKTGPQDSENEGFVSFDVDQYF